MVVSDPRAAKQKLWRHRGQPAWWAHSQSSNFQPVLNSKHMSNPTCFTQITHALKIKPCSAAELEWDQSVLPSLHRDHLKSCWVFFFFFTIFSRMHHVSGVPSVFPFRHLSDLLPTVTPMSAGVFSYLCFSVLQTFGVYVDSQNLLTFFQAKQHFCHLPSI